MIFLIYILSFDDKLNLVETTIFFDFKVFSKLCVQVICQCKISVLKRKNEKNGE